MSDYVRPDDWDEPVVIPEVKRDLDRILVPFDGSHAAERALAHADAVAERSGSEIVVIVAYDPPVTVRRRGILMVEQLRHDMESDAHELATESVGLLLERGRRARGIVVKGDIVQAILETAGAEGADLIVMGRRGLGQLQGMLLGSVSEKVARHASVPVFLVS